VNAIAMQMASITRLSLAQAETEIYPSSKLKRQARRKDQIVVERVKVGCGDLHACAEC
jgi:hypothetical protein